MILADSAQVADSKLYVLGGGWTMIGPDPTPCAVAILLEVDPPQFGVVHHWELFLEDTDGRAVLVEGPVGLMPIEARGEFQVGDAVSVKSGTSVTVPMAINVGPVPLAPGARYVWRLVVDGEIVDGGYSAFATRPTANTEMN
jgi:hypothetical protein